MNSTAQKRDRRIKMSSWQEDYKAKLTSPEDAAKLIKSNDRLFMGGGVNIPKAFATALGARAGELQM